MARTLRHTTLVACALLLGFSSVSPSVEAKVKYGPEQRECRPARAPGTLPGTRGPEIPQVPGGTKMQECRTCQQVEECTWLSKLRVWRCMLKKPKCTRWSYSSR
jgi:hypothetical protein